ncbi:WD40-repeat-containing domain protein [Pisolithus orientalis]|uniref:WD40-repeat-containing domain protein n=1 Tax=Pisolithus orientalis TaxID=936130 RepID=UPI002224DA92|nr:WD40-repeat-containing domain protein [Pisolithus orientalis]KAI6019839.1 WD40-repeat-containing domain protein [Pisolithus orientalis]
MTIDTIRGGSCHWMAPELLDDCSASMASDVWAFGMTTLLFTRAAPFRDCRNPGSVFGRLLKWKLPPRPAEESTQFRLTDTWWRICTSCWTRDPWSRPTMKDILEQVKGAIFQSYCDRDLHHVPPALEKEGRDWFVVFNPEGDKDRERLERDRERELRDRERDQRDRGRERPPVGSSGPKRIKTERMKSDRPDHYSPSLGAGPTKLPAPGGPPTYHGPVLPPPPSIHPPYAPGPGNPPPGGPLEPTPGASSAVAPAGSTSGSQFPDDLDPVNVPPEFKKDGSDWFAVFSRKTKRVLDVTLVHTLIHESVVCCVRFSADGKYLATGCNRTAQICDTKTGQKTCVLIDESAGKAGDLYIRSVCFSPDGKYLVTGAEDKLIRIWDIAKKCIRNVFDGHQQEIYSLGFSLDGRFIVSGSGDKTARIWDMVDGTSKVLTINDPDSLNNGAGVTSVAISPNGQLVAAGSLDTVVRIWDVTTGALVERLRGHRDSVYSVAFTPDGKGLVSGSLDKTLKYWDVSGLLTGGSKRKDGVANGKKDLEKTSQCTMNFVGHTDYVLSVAVSHDGQWVVSGSKDRGVQFWEAHSANVQCMLQGHKNSVISIDLSPAGNVLATGSGDWQARIWSYQTI